MAKKLEDSKMAIRGGSWVIHFLRTPTRFMVEPPFRYSFYGFRCCKPVLCLKQVKVWKEETEGGLFDG